MSMSLYIFCDDELFCDETWWRAVWASTYAQAAQYAQAHYDGDGPRHAPLFLNTVLAPGGSIQPSKDTPHAERRDAILRAAGFYAPGESPCSDCGLYAVDMPEHAVCPECGLCPACARELAEPCVCLGKKDAQQAP